ncbi:MAG TPA: hypothetical protein VL598_10830 [Trinickia sp.]|jgi:hypothetical protein|uniref:hypothetical protein n=1 Tax=Trinickia sp. TaxID=2571163 RepID=UPI002C8F3150|nr:hypothetical protein [Trinickia sp.]HTI18146.1 hypothetical protein [Trinickia sp.]
MLAAALALVRISRAPQSLPTSATRRSRSVVAFANRDESDWRRAQFLAHSSDHDEHAARLNATVYFGA